MWLNAMAMKLNTLRYRCLKVLLGADSLGACGHHRLMLFGQQAKAEHTSGHSNCKRSYEITALASTSPIPAAVPGALAVTGRSWLTDSLTGMANIGIEQDTAFENFEPALAFMRSWGKAVLLWKEQVLLIASHRIDAEWFQKEASLHVAPPWPFPAWAGGQAMAPFLTYSLGKKCADTQKHAGAGYVAPFVSLGRPDIARLQLCPLCREATTLQHYLGADPWAASRGGASTSRMADCA